ncbi:MAG TPA: sialate O-acetylesterase, partial [Blastocatellia bacterium]|nr:sialate O-acetylesterase [Blastocatellia bacterium]
RNVIAVRVFDQVGNGGFGGNPDQMFIGPDKHQEKANMRLDGDWLYKVELSLTPKNPDWSSRPSPPSGPNNPNSPSVLYNAMLAPLTPYAIRGVIWYQGESNAGRAYQYRTLFPTMIRDWRAAWGEGPFPFYFVQLANFMARKDQPGESDWAELREAQALTLRIPNSGMAVIIDIGEANDIHPKDKLDVGLRLARWALADTYGQKVESSGPLVRNSSAGKGRIRVAFGHTTGGLKTSDGGPIKGFAIAGADHKFFWAQAKIEGDAVVVWSDKVPEPVAVRYGWADNPDCNLLNGEGLPASPFRTDDWPGGTAGRN